MKFEKNIRNELFKRQEVGFDLESDKNPGFSEIRKQISEKAGKPEESIDVRNINGNFGSNIFKIDAYIYDSKEDLKKAEQKTQKQRKAEVEATKKEAEPLANEKQEEAVGDKEASEPLAKEQEQAKEEVKENLF